MRHSSCIGRERFPLNDTLLVVGLQINPLAEYSFKLSKQFRIFFFSIKRHNMINHYCISVTKRSQPNDLKSMRKRGKDPPSLNRQRKKEASSDWRSVYIQILPIQLLGAVISNCTPSAKAARRHYVSVTCFSASHSDGLGSVGWGKGLLTTLNR